MRVKEHRTTRTVLSGLQQPSIFVCAILSAHLNRKAAFTALALKSN